MEGRLIPAHAGSTRSRARPGAAAPAHPRSRGEHGAQFELLHLFSGSSPLTRGALAFCPLVEWDARLIPAHAGSTLPVSGSKGKSTAHPRSRGEHEVHAQGTCVRRGSSPLTRGAQGAALVAAGERRLIPAHAGSTGQWDESTATTTAHPRSRGEHTPASTSPSISGGSSPLTRGAQPMPSVIRIIKRLIPAHAGSTRSGRAA